VKWHPKKTNSRQNWENFASSLDWENVVVSWVESELKKKQWADRCGKEEAYRARPGRTIRP